MKCIAFIFFLLPFYILAQNEISISGKVTDKNTGTPLQAASVFAQNTTFGEATKSDGSFNLRLPAGGYDLIVTFTGYESSVTRISSTNNGVPLNIELRPKEKSLSEVSVVFSTEVKNGWEKYGNFFTDNFIGKTQYGTQTEIKNPEVLKFFYSKKRNRLKVTAEEPLILINKGLGYNIKYSIDSFAYEYNSNTATFMGYPLFQELPGNSDQKEIWKQNRLKVYNGSILHFMRSLYNKTVIENGFEIQFLVNENGIDQPIKLKDPYTALNYSKDDTLNIVELDPNQRIMAVIYNRAGPEPAYLKFDPNAKKDFRVSTISLNADASFFIERNGYYYEQADFIINGYWGFEKVGNMLPYDYDPSE